MSGNPFCLQTSQLDPKHRLLIQNYGEWEAQGDMPILQSSFFALEVFILSFLCLIKLSLLPSMKPG